MLSLGLLAKVSFATLQLHALHDHTWVGFWTWVLYCKFMGKKWEPVGTGWEPAGNRGVVPQIHRQSISVMFYYCQNTNLSLSFQYSLQGEHCRCRYFFVVEESFLALEKYILRSWFSQNTFLTHGISQRLVLDTFWYRIGHFVLYYIRNLLHS